MHRPRLVKRPTSAVPTAFAENYERVPEAAGAARALAGEALEVWCLPQLMDPVRLVMTELVTNAIRHARGEGMRVSVLRLTGDRVRISVLDRDCTRPELQRPDWANERGRGLRIVDAESATWGVDLLPGGKRVWAELVVTS